MNALRETRSLEARRQTAGNRYEKDFMLKYRREEAGRAADNRLDNQSLKLIPIAKVVTSRPSNWKRKRTRKRKSRRAEKKKNNEKNRRKEQWRRTLTQLVRTTPLVRTLERTTPLERTSPLVQERAFA